MVIKHTMRDFIGLEKADAEARQAMMNFSYLSAIGNMDEAFKAIKLIKRLKEYFYGIFTKLYVKTPSTRLRVQLSTPPHPFPPSCLTANPLVEVCFYPQSPLMLGVEDGGDTSSQRIT